MRAKWAVAGERASKGGSDAARRQSVSTCSSTLASTSRLSRLHRARIRGQHTLSRLNSELGGIEAAALQPHSTAQWGCRHANRSDRCRSSPRELIQCLRARCVIGSDAIARLRLSVAILCCDLRLRACIAPTLHTRFKRDSTSLSHCQPAAASNARFDATATSLFPRSESTLRVPSSSLPRSPSIGRLQQPHGCIAPSQQDEPATVAAAPPRSHQLLRQHRSSASQRSAVQHDE